MLETTLVLGAVAAVGLVVLLAAVLTAPVMIVLALGALLLGLVVGVPTGFWYHVVLYRIVSAKIAMPRKWWLSPSDLHVHLTDAEQRRTSCGTGWAGSGSCSPSSAVSRPSPAC